MCYSAMTIARYFIEKSEGTKTPMQLNKLTYIAHGWSLAIFNRPLIIEDIEAWKYGPVIPSLYYAFKEHGKSPVPYKEIEKTNSIKDDDRALLDKILNVYGVYEGIYLSALTHQEGTPWSKTWSPKKSVIMRDDIIKDYYVEMGKKNKEKLLNGAA